MKLFGVSVAYDEEETLKVKKNYEKDGFPPGKLSGVRVYNVTDEYDMFKKYCIATSRLGIVRIHVRKVISYWLFRLIRRRF